VASDIRALDGDLSKEIADEIAGRQLFWTGRFQLADGESSLGYVPVASCICGRNFGKIVKKIRDYIFEARRENRIIGAIVGLNGVGFAVSSIVALGLGIPVFGVHLRSNMKKQGPEQGLPWDGVAPLAGSNTILVITDVIASGNSLSYALEQLRGRKTQASIECISLFIDSRRALGEEQLAHLKLQRLSAVCNAMVFLAMKDADLPELRFSPFTMRFG